MKSRAPKLHTKKQRKASRFLNTVGKAEFDRTRGSSMYKDTAKKGIWAEVRKALSRAKKGA